MPENLKRKSFILKIDLFILLLCLAGLYQSAQKPGIPVTLQLKQRQIVVKQAVQSLNSINFHPGDHILTVNGKKVYSPDDVEFILDGLTIGQPIQLTIKRNARIKTIPIVLQPANSGFYLFILALVGFIFLGLGIVVLVKRPEGDRVAFVFHWLSATVALHITNTFGCYATGPLYLGYVSRFVFLGASAFTPVLFVHLSFLFPRRKWLTLQRYFKWLYLLSLLFFVYLSVLFFQAAVPQTIPVFHRFMATYNFGRWLFALSFIFAVGNFIHSYINAREETERRKLRWVILGLAIGPLCFALFWQLPQTFNMQPLISEELMLLITALTPLTFAISIVRYHLLDIDFIFNRSTVYFLVISLLLIIYAAIVGLAAMLVQFFTVKASLIISAFAAVIVAILFEPLRKSVQTFVDKRFFRIRYDYRQAQREFTQRMERCADVASLIRFIVERLDELLHPKKIELYLKNANGGWQKARAEKDFSTTDAQLVKGLQKLNRNILLPVIAVDRFVESGVPIAPADVHLFKANRIVLALPIRLQNAQTVGFLVLGKKKSATLYHHEDLDLLKTIVQQAALAIERIRLQKDLLMQHEQAERLQELNRLKSFFVSSVSHDLQTPLTSIRMFAELLQTSADLSDDQRQEYLQIIQGESERLSRLIRNVLDFSRLERGVKTYKFERVNLNEVLQSVLRSMKYQLEQSRFETVVELPEREIFIQADADAVAEAIENLISNAIKYSREHKFLRVTVKKKQKFALVEVQDKGIGIAPEEQRKIFETYYRSDSDHVKAMGGAGLGLSLVKHIMEAHGGRVEVESAPGKGSTFRLLFPEIDSDSVKR